MTKIIDALLKYAITLYGDENIEFKDNYIYIKFETATVTIENTNISHKIHDLYISIPFIITEDELSSSIKIDPILGLRTTFNEIEIMNGYIHSHLRRTDFNNLGYFNKFCLGESSLEHYRIKFNSEKDIEKKIRLGSVVINLIKDMVTTESTDGVPYISITELNNFNVLYENDKSKVITFIEEHLELFKYINITNNDFNYILSEKGLELKLTNITLNTKNINAKDLETFLEFGILAIYKNNILYANNNGNNNYDLTRVRKMLTFKNNDIYMKIIPSKKVNIEYVLPNIVKFYLLTYLNNFLTYKQSLKNIQIWK